MKKFTLFGVALALLLSGCARNKLVETTVLGMGTDYFLLPVTLKGKVKVLKELNYWASEKDGKFIKGNLMMKKDLDSIGSTPNLIAYFDENGLLTKYDQLDGETVIASSLFTIENGRWKRIESKMKDSTTAYFIPQYDNSGYLTGGSWYRPIVDTLTFKIIITNNNKGNITKIEYHNYRNERLSYTVCTPDEKGNNLEARFYNKADSLTGILANTYNENGNMIKQLNTDEKTKKVSSWEYKYSKSDEHGNAVQIYSVVENGKYQLLAEDLITYY